MIYPAYLWIGKPEDLAIRARKFIKTVLCKQNGCDKCVTCKQIEAQQHHLVRWLTPENQYTVNSLDIIFSTIIYALEDNSHFFFVLERADLLTPACANSLLKSLEEPPVGYHFILLSPWLEGLLPTIISRCIVENFKNDDENKSHPLMKFFTKIKDNASHEFSKEIDKSKIMERDILHFIDQLYAHWMVELKKAFEKNDTNEIMAIQRIIEIISKSREYPPMPGSSKAFLRNLYLSFNNL